MEVMNTFMWRCDEHLHVEVCSCGGVMNTFMWRCDEHLHLEV